jgi:hypothetical protein
MHFPCRFSPDFQQSAGINHLIKNKGSTFSYVFEMPNRPIPKKYASLLYWYSKRTVNLGQVRVRNAAELGKGIANWQMALVGVDSFACRKRAVGIK